jgi:sulfate adenylyltransferase
MSPLVPPHGGALVDRILTGPAAEALRARAARLPRLALDARELADLELVATGAASPLRGFLGERDYRSVLAGLRLADGTVWPLPFNLALPDDRVAEVRRAGAVALCDAAGRLWGVVEAAEIYRRDLGAEARAVYGTDDPAHPGVAYTLSRPAAAIGGEVQALPLPPDLPFAERRLTPRQLRERIAERGWRRVAGFQTRNPIHRAHEYLTKVALEHADGLVIHPLVGETKSDDVPAAVRFRAYEALLGGYYPPARTLLAAFPAAMRYAGPREALFHAVVRKNYGITHLIVGRDHAGVGKTYGPLDAHRIFDAFGPAEIGVEPLRFDAAFHCRACGATASPRTCPHPSSERLELSGTRVREQLRAGEALPAEFTRPEVAEILRAHYAGRPPHPHLARGGDSLGGAGKALTPLRHHRGGFILWFTGLSGAGKSTLSRALEPVLRAERPVEILDGDEVRTYLSKGLGFSREDRDTNIRRIGYLARLLARNGVAVAVAAISPYAATRAEVRALAEAEGVPFVEVFAQASIAKLAERDPKGLYRKALAGELPHFTGVSDPYEAPERPDVVVRSDAETVEESASRILSHLESRGLLRRAEARAS